MPSTRQDAWTPDEDLILAEIVLRHIREGGTQLQAFEEVGKQLSRTAAACGFRWNSSVRKQYKSGIELAKKQRKQYKKQVQENKQLEKSKDSIETNKKEKASLQSESAKSAISFDEVLTYLKKLYQDAQINRQSNNEQNIDKIKQLEAEVEELAKERERLTTELDAIASDYHTLIEIMEKARGEIRQQNRRTNNRQ
ncbi:RsfA family transcriptional regulator [Bacillus aquiflavi]|uniref:RsfA family transcriptional regulator n=1 Tax=Bacillus aquiflavi TaxID=2672567 RepID=A0A6B3W1M5_9BACI|nr:RsfA family transcriptional regulator [Bacillus aquiflavi]MBA4537626.1 RsfA family transcriptional regulator [Bacillus aquiflavi]NEY81883.1 RsfA family transcriptional regulator [Bacillus aquiflavi]UAC49295.1 RsfA family transcriptional regulator [Bacillus aquiflavi]